MPRSSMGVSKFRMLLARARNPARMRSGHPLPRLGKENSSDSAPGSGSAACAVRDRVEPGVRSIAGQPRRVPAADSDDSVEPLMRRRGPQATVGGMSRRREDGVGAVLWVRICDGNRFGILWSAGIGRGIAM